MFTITQCMGMTMEHQGISITEALSLDFKGAEVCYGRAETEIGELLIGVMDDAICWLGFYGYKADPVELMKRRFHGADFVQDDTLAREIAPGIIDAWHGDGDAEVEVELYGTAFQLNVWRALRSISYGERVNYQDIAQLIGQPEAVRAVGTAIGKNPVSLLVPCHRVLPKSGGVGNYLWGSLCKQRLLGIEEDA